MKPLFEDIDSKRGANSYVAYRYATTAFPFLWHYHPEYELTLILEGSGERMVGDRHEYFFPGDLVLLGPGLPHTWVSEMKSAAVVIQFSERFLAPMLQYPECDRIRQLLARASQGLAFPKNGVSSAIEALPATKSVGGSRGYWMSSKAWRGRGCRRGPWPLPIFSRPRGRRPKGGSEKCSNISTDTAPRRYR